jgi:hypothetical protein
MTSMSLRQGLNENTRNLQGGAFARNQNIMQKFSAGGQPMSLKEQAGLIQGPGTGKSDSIEAKLPVKGFVLPVEVVQAIGPDKLQAMIDQFQQDSPTMDSEEVDAKVSNGEFFVPPEVVAKTGPEYWDSLVQQVTGSPAQPEISQEGVKAAGGYGPNLSDERQAAQQFWSQPNRTVTPTPGRANPANPSDVMRDRMQTSVVNSQTQAQGLRSQISQNLANPQPVQAPIQPVSLKAQAQQAPAVNTTRQPAVSYFNAPKPPTLKDQLLGVGNDIALATSLASDVLQAPHIAKNRDEAISGLKARAGFSPTATPFQYAEGGYVDPDEELKRYQSDVAQRRPDLIAQGPIQQAPTTFQNMQQTLKDSALAPTINAFGEGVKNAVKSGQQANQDYEDLRQQGYGVIPAALKNSVDQYAKAGKAIGNVIEPAFSSLKSGVNNLYGIPSSNSQETQQPTQQPSSLKAAVFNPEQDKPKVVQTNEQTTPSLKEAVKTLPADPTTGFRYDGAPQTLDWNESRFSNSGDVAQDSALADRQAARSAMRDQVDLTQPEVQSDFTKTKDGFSRSSRFGGVKPDYPTTSGQSALGLEKLTQDQAQFDKIYALKEQEANKNMPEELGDDAYSAIDDIKKGDMTGAVYMMQKYPKTLKVLRETYPDLFSNFGSTNG